MKALVFHGMGSSPQRVGWLAGPLEGMGFTVVAPQIREVEDGYEAGMRELPVKVAAGHSMGGTVALLLAARNPGSVGCVVAVASPVDRRLQMRYLMELDDPQAQRLARHLQSLGDRLDLTSPARWIGPNMPPVLYIRGSRDSLVPRAHVDLLVGLAERYGTLVEVVEVEGMAHGPATPGEAEAVADAVKRFVSRC